MEITSRIPASLPVSDAPKNQGRAAAPAAPAQTNKTSVATAERVAEAQTRTAVQSAPPLPGHRDVRLTLHIDDRTGQVFGRFVDRNTGDMVQEVPAEDLRRLAAQIDELLGPAIDQSV
ncbi:MAG: flagellar protein FlaG [Alphaproteobacteria bacterium]|nr:flagellar protein FlaG [Alphaproteobacteria bacterium]